MRCRLRMWGWVNNGSAELLDGDGVLGYKRTSDGMVRADGVESRMDGISRVALSLLEIGEEGGNGR